MKRIITVIVLVLIVAAVGGAIIMSRSGKRVEFSSTIAEKITLEQSVEETGQVKADFEGTYGFEISGSVASIQKRVGATVTPGIVIAELQNTTQLQALRQAQASLASDQALLNKELAGVSEQQKAESLAVVSQAQASLTQAKAQLLQTVAEGESSVATAQRAVETAQNELRVAQETGVSKITQDAYADALNSMNTSLGYLRDALTGSDNILGIDNALANDSLEDALGITSQQTLIRAEQLYPLVKQSITIVETNLSTITSASDQSAIDTTLLLMDDALTEMRQLLTTIDTLLSNTPAIGVTQSTLDTYRAGIITDLTNINTQLTNNTNAIQTIEGAATSLSLLQIALDKAKQDLTSALDQANARKQVAEANIAIQEAAVAKAQAAYESLVAPPRAVDIGSLRAAVQRSNAAVISAQKELEKTQLRAIATGTISLLDIEVGENVTANTHVITILSDALYVDLDISESDIAKVSLNDPAEITLDAFGDDVVFDGHVQMIDPAETEISGVIYYQSKILFDNPDKEQIKPGMTANVRIVTDKRPDVVVIPLRAVIRDNGRTFVRVVTDAERGTYDERDVTIGLRGDEGQTEITSGISEGEEVITFIQE